MAVRRWRALAGAGVLGGLAWFALSRGEPPRAATTRATEAGAGGATAANAPGGANASGTATTANVAAPDDERAHNQRLERAQQALDTYLRVTRYPPGARPLAEHPDQARPHHVEPVTVPLAHANGQAGKARLVLRQDRYFVVGDERALLSINCLDGDGRPAACTVTAARATVPPSAGGHAEAAVSFADDGQGGQAATLAPRALGFGDYHGTIRVSADVSVGDESGSGSFDVQYTPRAPASFTGHVREVLEAGSLDLLVEIEVQTPGRYMIHGRVDDRAGTSFAYLGADEELGAGRQEVRLELFGKLVRDQAAPSPFALRDLEGFLFKEDAFPDRELMPLGAGVVYRTRAYDLGQFSDADWDSDDKRRRVAALEHDVDRAHAGN